MLSNIQKQFVSHLKEVNLHYGGTQTVLEQSFSSGHGLEHSRTPLHWDLYA